MKETIKKEQPEVLKKSEALWNLGFAIHWLYPRSKKPVGTAWTSGPRHSWKELRRAHLTGYNVGVRTGEASQLLDGYLACIDVDVKTPEAKDIAYTKLKEVIGDKNNFPTVATGRGNGSIHLYCVTLEPFNMITIAKEKTWEICVYSNGRQMVLPPSIHPDTKRKYKWIRPPSQFPLFDFAKWENKSRETKSKSDNLSRADTSQTRPDFEIKDVDLTSVQLPESMRRLITECIDPKTRDTLTDRSAYLPLAADALYTAGLSRSEVLSVLSDKWYELGKCAYDHTGSNDRKRAMQWLWNYSVQKAEEQRNQKPLPENQAKKLAAIADELTELFHTPDGEEYASAEVNGHKETYAIRSTQFKKWLIQEYRRRNNGGVPGNQALQDALAAIGAKAQYDGAEKQVHLRVAKHEDKIYVDLCNQSWESVEIDSKGWRVVDKSPVKFRRANGMMALPQPAKVGAETTSELRSLLNVRSSSDFRLIIAWLMNCFNPVGPYLVLVLYAEQGSGKSTLVKMLRELVDPNISPLRREPRNTDDLLVSAKGNWVVSIDNMSYLPDWLSDDFCRLSTGGALAKRAQYTNDEEFVLNAKRPVILNGIDEFVVRGDLANRSIVLRLPTISKGSRQREEDLWNQFEKSRPQFLGLLFHAISTALRNRDKVDLSQQFRMADALHWATASESAFGWKSGAIVRAYERNQHRANDVVLENSPLYPYLQGLSEAGDGWNGTATDLLRKLNDEYEVSEGTFFKERGWPRTPKVLSDKIRRLAPSLRLAGIEVTFNQTSGANSQKLITLKKVPFSCDASDAETPTSKRSSDSSVAKKTIKSSKAPKVATW